MLYYRKVLELAPIVKWYNRSLVMISSWFDSAWGHRAKTLRNQGFLFWFEGEGCLLVTDWSQGHFGSRTRFS